MEKNYFRKSVATTLVVGCMCLLSSCYEIIVAIEGGEKLDWCNKQVLITGPDKIFFDPCEPQEVECSFYLNDGPNNVAGTPYDTAQLGVASEIVVSGDIEIVSKKPFMIRATGLANGLALGLKTGKGTITVKTTVPNYTCYDGVTSEKEAKDGSPIFQITSTRDIIVELPTIDIKYTVCKDSVTGLGAGTLTVIDPNPGQQNYIWTVSKGSANLTALSNSPDCSISSATKGLKVTVQKIESKCTTEPIEFDVDISVCKP